MVMKPLLKWGRLGDIEGWRGRSIKPHFDHTKYEMVPSDIQVEKSSRHLGIKMWYSGDKSWLKIHQHIDGDKIFKLWHRTRSSKERSVNVYKRGQVKSVSRSGLNALRSTPFRKGYRGVHYIWKIERFSAPWKEQTQRHRDENQEGMD